MLPDTIRTPSSASHCCPLPSMVSDLRAYQHPKCKRLCPEWTQPNSTIRAVQFKGSPKSGTTLSSLLVRTVYALALNQTGPAYSFVDTSNRSPHTSVADKVTATLDYSYETHIDHERRAIRMVYVGRRRHFTPNRVSTGSTGVRRIEG